MHKVASSLVIAESPGGDVLQASAGGSFPRGKASPSGSNAPIRSADEAVHVASHTSMEHIDNTGKGI